MKTAVFFETEDKMVIKAGSKGTGKIIAQQSFGHHQCNAGCRCDEITAPYKAELFRIAAREGYDVKEAFELGLR